MFRYTILQRTTSVLISTILVLPFMSSGVVLGAQPETYPNIGQSADDAVSTDQYTSDLPAAHDPPNQNIEDLHNGPIAARAEETQETEYITLNNNQSEYDDNNSDFFNIYSDNSVDFTTIDQNYLDEHHIINQYSPDATNPHTNQIDGNLPLRSLNVIGTSDTYETQEINLSEFPRLGLSSCNLNKNNVKLTVTAPTKIASTPGEFTIDFKIENILDHPIENLNLYLRFLNAPDFSLVAPIPNIRNMSIKDVSTFSIDVSVPNILNNKICSFEVYLTHVVQDPDAQMDLEYLVSSHSQQLCLIKSPEKKAIIIVPGIVGSELFSASSQWVQERQYSRGWRIWPPEGSVSVINNADSDIANLVGMDPSDILNMDIERIIADFEIVSYNPDGTSKLDVMLSNPINCRHNSNNLRSYGTANMYKELTEKIMEQKFLDDYDVILFSYDWRRSNSETSQALKEYINKQNYSNVVLISHSMGGLLCSAYLCDSENCAHVDKFISVCTPFWGAVKAVRAMEEGKFFGGFKGTVSSPMVKEMCSNLPSLYELFPPKQYFDFTHKGGYLAKIKPSINLLKPKRNIETFEETEQILIDRNWSSNSKTLLKNAQNFHDGLYDDQNNFKAFNNDDVKVYNICGYNLPALDKLTFKYNSKNEFQEISSITKVNGDGTVSLISTNLNEALPEKQTYYVKDVNHVDLIKNKDSMDLIINILRNHPDEFNPLSIRQRVPSNKISTPSCCLPKIITTAPAGISYVSGKLFDMLLKKFK